MNKRRQPDTMWKQKEDGSDNDTFNFYDSLVTQYQLNRGDAKRKILIKCLELLPHSTVIGFAV
jgi:hypothetical protein